MNSSNSKHYYFLSFLIYNAQSFEVAPVAQLDRVPGFEPVVGGSNPSGRARLPWHGGPIAIYKQWQAFCG